MPASTIAGNPTAKILSAGAARVTIPMQRLTNIMVNMMGSAISTPPRTVSYTHLTLPTKA